jgi:hypothetical protein
MITKPSAALIAVAILAVAIVSLSAAAKDTAKAHGVAGSGSGVAARYMFNRVKGGFLRLDTQTGLVSLCGPQAVGWACLAVPEDRAVLENEIVRLRSENGALKAALLSRALPLPPGVAPQPSGIIPQPPAPSGRTLTVRLPGAADVDRVIGFVGQIWRRLVAAIADAQNRLLHAS